MKKVLMVSLLFILACWRPAYPQDDIYGDYLLGNFERTVSLDLESANLMDVLKMLSQQTKINFVSTEAIRNRTLTLYLEDVPLKEAIDVIFKANNLTYNYFPDSNVFVVKEMGKPAIELKTKVYFLKHIWLSTTKLDEELYYNLSARGTTTAGGAGGIGGGGGGGGTTGGEEEEGIKVAVEQVVTEFGKVTEDPMTNSLIVVDVPAQFPVIDELIAELDRPKTRVMIEVEMLDVNKTYLDKIGFNFANGLQMSFTPGSRTSFFPFSLAKKSLHTGEGVVTAGTLTLANTTLVMQFLKQETTTKVLARPKILTLSGETAEVKLTTDEAIGLTTTQDATGTTTESVERAETGTQLRVTPHINLNSREITLYVDVSNKSASDSGLSSTSLAGNFQNIEERGTKSVVRLKDGETLYIGGLIKKEESEIKRKIPLLGDLPVIGRVFRYREKPVANNIDRELLVFLTPRIMNEESFLDQEQAMSSQRNTLRREQVDFSKRKALDFALDSFDAQQSRYYR